ncbi:Paxillin 1, partial [Podila horticola]
YQNILEGGISKPSKRMSMPASSLAPKAQQHQLQHQHQHQQQPTPQPLVLQKQCHGCQKAIHQAKVFVEPGKPTFLYCEKCYTEKFTKGMCPSCFKPVMSKTDPYVTHAQRSWHTACFVCFKCRLDLSQSPMVDLRGRPCCEDCLMAQAGDGSSPDQGRSALTPLDRSLAGSPTPSSSPSQAIDHEDHDSFSRQNPSLRLNVDSLAYQSPVQQSPLSAQSTASHSSLANSFRQAASSGYTSGTSSTYSSLGRKRSHSSVPTAIAATSTTRKEGLSPHFSYQRPGSALSVHSHTSSRPTSPGPAQDLTSGSRNHSRQGSSSGPSTEEPLGLRRTRSRSMVGMDDLGSSQRASTPSDVGSRSSTPLANLSVDTPSSPETELVSSAKKLSISTTSLDARSAPPVVSRPTSTRERSRSSVGSATTGMVRARTEAWMNQSQSSMSPPPKSNRQSPSTFGYRMDTKPTPLNTSPRTRDDATSAGGLEAEPNRSSLHRHGRQRSNTVGEAISFPAVKVDSLASPTLQRAAIPENHCHKCLERVTENGIRLQNGDRFHIGCFLCFGCNQIFTESEFHVVNGRPYHPACVSMAPSINITGVVTKCFQCHKIIGNKSIRLGGMNYHPDCFQCTHCHKVLLSTSRFFEVDGRVECEQCCEERDRERLAPKIVPVARRKDNFAVPPPAVPVMVKAKAMEPSGPGMMATGVASPVTGYANNLVRSGSGYASPNGSGQSSPVRSPASPAFSYPSHLSPKDQDASSSVIMMASPSAIRSTPPVLTSLFSTRTRPLPKFGGVTTCPRCQQAVGVMDQVPGPKNEKWHKKCLNCKDCKKNLDSSAMTRGEGEAYCRGCFNKTRVRV